ncbi:MAG: hypothetical protein HZC40_01930 [Chloroflexi bacterium]|nr:hypothetical protein [Chloroflexota bacterium]
MAQLDLKLIRFLRWLATLSIVILVLAHLVFSASAFQRALAPLWERPTWSYADKMQKTWGAYFPLMQFVQQQTPDDAVLLLDPYYGAVDFYFLYPRRILHGGAEMLRQHPEIQYVVINDRDFPNFPVAGTKLMLNEHLGLYKLDLPR